MTSADADTADHTSRLPRLIEKAILVDHAWHPAYTGAGQPPRSFRAIARNHAATKMKLRQCADASLAMQALQYPEENAVKPRVVQYALLAFVAGISIVTGQAQAQAWPDKPITFIVPFAAGGGTDAFARPLAAQLDAQLGKRVLIENRAGAGGTVGASAAAKAAPDGYTFFMGAAHHAIAPSLYPNLDYNIEKDFIAVALIARPPQVVVVNPDKVTAKTLAEFIAYAKANPGKLNYGSAGAGTTHHLAGELFKILTKTNISARPLSRRRSCDAGSHCRPRACRVRRARLVGCAGQGRATARTCRRRAEARAGVPRSSDRRRGRPARL